MIQTTFRATLLLAGLVSAAAHGQAIPDDVAERATALQALALEENMAYDVVESLTQEVGPRPAGSAGDRAAVRWAIDKLMDKWIPYISSVAPVGPYHAAK